MRSRVWLLILKELPFPLRWIGTEIIRFAQWIDALVARIARGLRDAPAWYLVTTIGSFAVVLTLSMFISLISETSGQKTAQTARRRVEALTRQDLEKRHDWSVQDRWRVAHLFVAEKPDHGPHNIPLDSRLMTATPVVASRAARSRSDRNSRTKIASRSDADRNLEVRLELGRPKKAQQENRVAAGTVLIPGYESVIRNDAHPRRRNPRALVQATWEFNTECSPQEYTSRPQRRPVVVPLPEPETIPPPVIARKDKPDLSFELDMVRHFSVAGLFPPGSHLVSSSVARTSPDLEERFASELVSHEDGPWMKSQPHRQHSAAEIMPYEGLGTRVPSHHSPENLDEYNPDLPAVADVTLGLNVEVPVTVTAGKVHRLGLTVSNHGHDSISRVEIRDHLAHLNTVVGAEPDAERDSVFNAETGDIEPVLHRELLNLIPGERQDLSLKWIPDSHARQIRRIQVIAHAEVSTETEVVPPSVVQQMPSIPPERVQPNPALACDIDHLDRVTVGKDVELQITVRNTGNTTLHHVKVKIDVPSKLSHSRGRDFVFDAGNLPVNGRNRTVVRLAALESGQAVSRIHVESDESVNAKGQMVIHIDDRKTAKIQTPQASAPKPAAKPQTSAATSTWVPSGFCCCQKPIALPDFPRD